jgi:hypothetical protein
MISKLRKIDFAAQKFFLFGEPDLEQLRFGLGLDRLALHDHLFLIRHVKGRTLVFGLAKVQSK